MSLRLHIIVMTALAVVSDAILIPFYPQFFSARYGLDSAVHVGAYVAAISIAVMCTLPLWARVARRVEPLHLLVYTQCAAGTLCLMSYRADGVAAYWVLSMLMFMCKSSYLLMYPYLMRLEPKEAHASIVGILSVVVHFGAIFGAVAGGLVMQYGGADKCVLAMAAGDFVQMAVCAHLIRSGKIIRVNGCADNAKDAASGGAPHRRSSRWPIVRLALVMLAFDFSAYLIRPFFALYWQHVTGSASELLSGTVFAIPGMVAIAALRINKRARRQDGALRCNVPFNLLLGTVGLLLQAAPAPAAIVLGRCLYGWALFQVIVRLDVALFRLSTPQAYAHDYSIINFFQNLGVLLSSFAAGAIVSRYGLYVPFVLAAAGFVLTLLCDRLLFNAHAGPAAVPAAAEIPPHAS